MTLFSSRSFAALVCAAVLTACSSVPIMSLPKLAGFNPETADFANIELAVRVQDDFNVKPGSAVFGISIDNKTKGELLNEQIILETDPRPLTPLLQKKLKPGFQIIRYSVDEATAERASDIRARVLALKEADPNNNRGSMSASAGICRMPDGNPLLSPSMTIFLRLDPEDEFFTLIKETRLPLDMSAEKESSICEAP